jgi:hypothetical protein
VQDSATASVAPARRRRAPSSAAGVSMQAPDPLAGKRVFQPRELFKEMAHTLYCRA